MSHPLSALPSDLFVYEFITKAATPLTLPRSWERIRVVYNNGVFRRGPSAKALPQWIWSQTYTPKGKQKSNRTKHIFINTHLINKHTSEICFCYSAKPRYSFGQRKLAQLLYLGISPFCARSRGLVLNSGFYTCADMIIWQVYLSRSSWLVCQMELVIYNQNFSIGFFGNR